MNNMRIKKASIQQGTVCVELSIYSYSDVVKTMDVSNQTPSAIAELIIETGRNSQGIREKYNKLSKKQEFGDVRLIFPVRMLEQVLLCYCQFRQSEMKAQYSTPSQKFYHQFLESDSKFESTEPIFSQKIVLLLAKYDDSVESVRKTQ